MFRTSLTHRALAGCFPIFCRPSILHSECKRTASLTRLPSFTLSPSFRRLCEFSVSEKNAQRGTWQKDDWLRTVNSASEWKSVSDQFRDLRLKELSVEEVEQCRATATNRIKILLKEGSPGNVVKAAGEVPSSLRPTVLFVAVEDHGLDRFNANALAILLHHFGFLRHAPDASKWNRKDILRLQMIVGVIHDSVTEIRRDVLMSAVYGGSFLDGVDVFPLLESVLNLYFVQIHRLEPREICWLAEACSRMQAQFSPGSYNVVFEKLFTAFIRSLWRFDVDRARKTFDALVNKGNQHLPIEYLECLDEYFSKSPQMNCHALARIAASFTAVQYKAIRCTPLFKATLTKDFSDEHLNNISLIFQHICFVGQVGTDILNQLVMALPFMLRREARPFRDTLSVLSTLLAKQPIRDTRQAKEMALMIACALGNSSSSITSTRSCISFFRSLNTMNVCSCELRVELFERIALEINTLTWGDMAQFVHGLAQAVQHSDCASLLKKLSQLISGYQLPKGELNERSATLLLVAMGKLRWVETKWVMAVMEYIQNHLVFFVRYKQNKLQYLILLLCHLNHGACTILRRLDEVNAIPTLLDNTKLINDRVDFVVWLVRFNIWPVLAIESIMAMAERRLDSFCNRRLMTLACLNAMITNHPDAGKFRLRGAPLVKLRERMISKCSHMGKSSCVSEISGMLRSNAVWEQHFTEEGLLVDLAVLVDSDGSISNQAWPITSPAEVMGDGRRAIAILARHDRFFSRDSLQPLGTIATCCHALHALGWQVLLIPLRIWQHAEDRKLYLRRQLEYFGVTI